MNTARKTLDNWLRAWQSKKSSEMVEYSQLTWQKTNFNNGKNWLHSYIKNQRLISYEIVNSKKLSEVFYEFEVKVKIKYNNILVKNETRIVNVTKELQPYTPSKEGKWGINPQSSLRKK